MTGIVPSSGSGGTAAAMVARVLNEQTTEEK